MVIILSIVSCMLYHSCFNRCIHGVCRFVKLCDKADVIIEDYVRKVVNKKPRTDDDPDHTDFDFVLECKSCHRKTVWHRGTGIRFLLDDYRRNGIRAVPHYHCSSLLDLKSRYKTDRIISSILRKSCERAKVDEWRVTSPCGGCTACSTSCT